jgi:transmembrane sensor
VSDDFRRRQEVENFRHPDPVTDAALDWLLQLEAAPDDTALHSQFEAWCRSSRAHAEAFRRLAETDGMPELALATRILASTVGPKDQKPRQRLAGRRRRPIASAIVATAASILVLTGIGLKPSLMLHWQSDYMTKAGSRQQITLPDGSEMTLNTASAVSLDFEDGRRSVHLLDGEAYFDVRPDASHPFKVVGRFSEVEVKGTEFSVKTEPEEDLVVLQHGLVEVRHLAERTEKAILDPGDTISATANSLSRVRRVDTAGSLAWLEGRIIFHDKPLSQVIADVSRYYSSPVLIASRAVGKTPVSGNYRLTDPEGTIRSLAAAAGATVTEIPGGFLILR